MLPSFRLALSLSCLFFLCPFSPRAADHANSPAPEIDVILWFDTEDYMLPASDDSAKRLAELLSERGIRATFKVVGEKARTLERRGRTDVIAALKKHAIGFHANYHSVHPTPTEYLADCGWLDGVAEFVRREGPGAADVRRVFGVDTLVCYGQPGSSWGAQTYAGLKSIGIAPHGVPCYVDEGDHVGLDEKPFWYDGVLTVYHMGKNYTRMDLHDPGAVAPAKEKATQIAQRLRNDGGGLISIFYHPCEWVHQEFWDGVNFRRGANPPREEWKAPPQRTTAETEGAFERFASYIDHIRAIPGVRFVTADDLPLLYPDRAQTAGAETKTLDAIASKILGQEKSGLDFVVLDGESFSLADQFDLLTRGVAARFGQTQFNFPFKTRGLLGPDSAVGSSRALTEVPFAAFRDATRDVLNFIQREGRVPSRVFFGSDAIAPADYLVALADVWQNSITSPAIRLRHATPLLPEHRVAADTPGLFGGWVIHKENFRAPKVMEMAKLQAWTLKPALRALPLN